MIETAIGSMVCPLCRSPLILTEPRRRRGEVRRGVIVCAQRNHRFDVVAGIPVMLPPGMLADWTDPFTKILIGDTRLDRSQKRRMMDPLAEYAEEHGIQKMRDTFSAYLKGEHQPPAKFWDKVVDQNMIREGAYRLRKTEVERHLKRIEEQGEKNESIQEQVRRVIDLRPRRFVDVCCGGGFFTGWLLKTYQQYEIMFALDIDYNCAKRLEATFRQHAVSDRSVPLVADVRTLPLPDSSFDLVTSRYGASHVMGYPRGLREVFRTLRPGGHFVSTNRIGRKTPHKELSLEAVEQISRCAGLYIDKEDYLQTIEQTGFLIEEVADLESAFLTVCKKHNSSAG